MARKLNKILNDIDTGKNPSVDQEKLLVELSEVVEGIAKGAAPDSPKVNTPEGTVDFKYLGAVDKLVHAQSELKKARSASIEIATQVGDILVAGQTQDAEDVLIDAQSVAIISKSAILRNLSTESGSSLF